MFTFFFRIRIHLHLYRYFSEAALDIFNCHYIIINETVFEHNIGSGMDKVEYRGNSGAVAVGYNNVPSNPLMLLQVTNSIFLNNSATATTSFQTSTNLVTNRVYTGRGGALALYQQYATPNNLTIIIKNCNFINNSAQSYGGAMYLNAITNLSLVEKTTISFNTAGIGGGGLAAFHPTISIVQCNITYNRAFAGGGVFIKTTVISCE